MGAMKLLLGITILCFISLSRVKATCVLNSDFGFTLDCAFKKSGLFRVRNLGGIKAHVGLGFSVGDELGFGQSLTNLDSSKRRSVNAKNGAALAGNGLSNLAVQQNQKETLQKPKKNRLTVRIPSTSTTPAPSTTDQTILEIIPIEDNAIQVRRSENIRQLSMNKPASSAIPPFKPIPPAQGMIAPLPTVATQNVMSQYSIPSQTKVISMTQNQKAVNMNRMGQVPKSNFVNVSAAPMRVLNVGQSVRNTGYSTSADQAFRTVPAPVIVGTGPQYPAFQAMPASISRIPTGDSSQVVASVSVVSPQAYKNTVQIPVAPTMMTRYPNAASFAQNTISIRKEQPSFTLPPQYQSNNYAQLQNHVAYNQATKLTPKIDNMVSYNTINQQQNTLSDYPEQGTMYEKILAISKATNLSVEAIEAAIKLRQQQIISQMLNTPPSTTSTSTTTTTPRPPPPPPPPPPKRYTKTPDPAQKVMNAPKEYYPVGYDKNFDDNFVSKVELPETSFYCGDQKHFPGLYGDEDLGCMVFHVCALTDEGLIMKSFLCPESTLFDQTILKCNWWFYVDCKSSKRLYDSNIPISKSYQLMKALTFFSSYKKEQSEDQNNNVENSGITENKEGVRNAVKILQNQSHMVLPKVEIIEKSNPTNTQAIRNSKVFTPVNVVEINSLSGDVAEIENSATENVEKVTESAKPKPVSRHRTTYRKETIQTVKNHSNNATISTSTEKSVVQSTSVRRSSIRRNHTQNRAKENTSNTTKSVEDNVSQRHRIERASEEVSDVEVKENVESTTQNINKPKAQSNIQVIAPNRDTADATIAKMDEAIIGQKKKEYT